MAKLVTVATGSVFGVYVDTRPDSKTFGAVETVHITPGIQVFVPQGVCNGFQALIKLGLLPFGKIKALEENAPTLTFNNIGRHVSAISRVRVASNASAWLNRVKTGDVFSVPVSHGEGRFVCDPATLQRLRENGQIFTQYVDLDGKPTMQSPFNPNGSVNAVEGIISPDGRVLGKMGHAERIGKGLYRNVAGNWDMGLFRSGVEYFK